MKSAVTVSLVPQARGGPFVFWDDLEQACSIAAELGFDAIEIFPPSGDAIDRLLLTDMLAHHQLQLAAVGTGAGWLVHRWTLTDADPDVRRRAREFVEQIIDFAGAFSAPAIIGYLQGRHLGDVVREAALDHLGAALVDLAAGAAAKGTTLLYEPLNRYETNLFNRLAPTAEWLKTLPAPNIRILADLFHMNLEESFPPQALVDAGNCIGHVHFADSNRCAVGMGHTDIGAIRDSLWWIDYKGYLSAEILPLPDSREAARQTIESYRTYFGHLREKLPC